MPTYEYECAGCGHTFERFQSIIEEPLAKCPECGGKVRRLIGPGAAILMKGRSTDGRADGCSLESAGRTCCGRDERCAQPPCTRQS